MPGDGHFPKTRWTLIGRLKSPDAAEARRAQYHYPLYCYIRRRGLDHHDAEDALHDFLAKLLRHDTFAEADAAKGHLRSFLSTALQRFLINWQRGQSQRAREISVDAHPPGTDAEERYRHESFTERDTPDRVFDRKWGHELLRRVLSVLGDSYAARGKTALFAALRPALIGGGSLRGEDTPQLAAGLGLSEGALRVAHSRLLIDFRETLVSEVLVTVGSTDAVDAEITHLLQVFRKT